MKTKVFVFLSHSIIVFGVRASDGGGLLNSVAGVNTKMIVRIMGKKALGAGWEEGGSR